ncbi:MAG: efflux RND transporter permease subunit, partial [Chloroflexi bacterium]|nr:efflux RND transporter permease subunit [Chloroflexota bacterium]
FVRRSLQAVGTDLGLAALLTGLVLLVFLHTWRSTFIVLVSIPASLLCTFLVMWAAGLSLNLMTLMALAMTIGILVDDSIVVLENIHRHLADGASPTDAAIAGRTEIGMAAIAITLTDVVVYLPVAFMQGNIGQLFRQYGLTVAAATLASLLVSFTLTPLLAAHWGRSGAEPEDLPGPLGWLARSWETWLARWRRRYDRALVGALQRRKTMIVSAVAALAIALALIPLRWVGTEYAPIEDDNQFSVSLSMAPDASLEATDATTRRLEKMLAEIPGVLHIYSSVGGGSASAVSRSSATVFVELTDRHTRTRTAAFIMSEVRAWGREEPEATVRASGSATLGGGGGGVQVLITGEDLATLTALADEVALSALVTPGVASANSTAAASLQERRYVFDRERAAALGINAAQAASALRAVIQGVTVSTIPTPGGGTMDLTVLGPGGADPEAMSGVPVGMGKAGIVRLGQVAVQQSDAAPVQITRTDRVRSVSVNVAVADRPLGDTVQDLQERLDALALPAGYHVEVRGAALQLELAMNALLGALALSAPRMAFYVGAVIASTFVVAIRPSVAANLPLVVDEPNELVAANVVIGWVTAAATLLGPLMVALTISIGSGAAPLFVFAGVTAAGAAVASTVPNFRERTVESAPGDDGVRKLAGSSGPFVAVVLIGAASFVVGCVDLLYVVVGVGVLGGTEASAGWLSTAAGCGALVGGALAVLLIGRKRLWPWVLAAGAFTATALALLGASGSVLIAALVFAGVDLGVTVLLIAARTLLQRLSDIDTLSHLAGIAESAEMAMLLAGAIALPLFVKISSPAGSGVLVGAVVGVTIVAAAVVLIRIEASFVVPVEALGLLRSCQLLELLPAPALETLAGAAVRIELSDGEVLFSAGDVGDRYYVIAGGQVRMTSEGAEIAVRGPGEGFGELALLHPIGRTATATAVGDV